MSKSRLAFHAVAAALMSCFLCTAHAQTYWVEQITADLNLPSAMAWLPPDEMLIAQRSGDLRILRHGKLDPRAVRGVPASYPGPYEGVHDLALDPDFDVNHTLYLLLAEGAFEHRHAAVYRARYRDGVLENPERIFRSKDEVGGIGTLATRILFLSDKTLLIGVAEDHKQGAQQLSSHLGKILRINRDGSIPSDNPFLNTPAALPEIWTYGHRVPTGLYQDPQSREIWECEPGPAGGDEINVLKAGANYGWAKTSWGFAYANNGLEAPFQTARGIENPVVVWTPSVTPGTLTRYLGRAFPQWTGDFFVGYLSGKALQRLRFAGHRAILQETLLLDLDERIRDVRVGPDQLIYLLTDSGRLLRLRPGRPQGRELARVARKAQGLSETSGLLLDSELGDPVQGQQAFVERCAACHSVGAVIQGGRIGPDLADVYGRPWGRQPDFDYSAGMADGSFVWTADQLNRFLTDPASLIPGAKMTIPPVSDAQMRRQIIGFLKRESTHE